MPAELTNKPPRFGRPPQPDRPPDPQHLCRAWVVLLALAAPLHSEATAEPPANSPDAAQMAAIVGALPAGTPVYQRQADRFNRLLLIATPELSSGDVDTVSRLFRDAVDTYSLTMMATVRQTAEGFRLAELGMGYSYPIGDQQIVITSESADRLGASLGIIQKQVLAENERQLKPPDVLIRTTTLILFDVPGQISIDGRHFQRSYRQIVWVHPTTGRLSMAVWLVEQLEDGTTTGVDTRRPIHLVSENTVEQRKVHVDGSQFFLGVPTEKAFAMEDLPPGQPVSWTPSREQALGRNSYDEAKLEELLEVLNEAIASADPATP